MFIFACIINVMLVIIVILLLLLLLYFVSCSSDITSWFRSARTRQQQGYVLHKSFNIDPLRAAFREVMLPGRCKCSERS